MSFPAIETSVENGRPAELLSISVAALSYFYTTAAKPIVHNGRTYNPEPFQHPSIEGSGEVTKSSLSIRLSAKAPVGELFRASAPSGVVIATLYQHHIDDNDFYVAWKGRVVDSQWQPPYLDLTVENVYASLQRPGIQRKIGAQCPLALYGQGSGKCNVNREEWREHHTVTAVSRMNLTVPSTVGKPNDWFAGGYIEWVNPANSILEKRMVRQSNGTTGVITLTSLPMSLSPGQVISAFPGCDRTLSDSGCKRFSNTINFGGQPFIPRKNAFVGDSSY